MDEINRENPGYDFGMIGLGVMGRNLLLNMADHGYVVTGYDKDIEKGKVLETALGRKSPATLGEMVGQLKKPRKMMMLVPAGPIVDA